MAQGDRGKAAAEAQPSPASPKGLRPRGRRRGRAKGGVGDFAATSFILDAVRASGSSDVRPRDIVLKVIAAAPGRHVKPLSALVSTTLRRLEGPRQGNEAPRTDWIPAAA